MKLYQKLAQLVTAYNNCVASNNVEWQEKHAAEIEGLSEKYLPHGSGYDEGTGFDYNLSINNRLVFETAFHHMDEHGFYTAWTEHMVTVVPDLAFGFTIKVSGKNKNNIKEMIAEDFDLILNTELE